MVAQHRRHNGKVVAIFRRLWTFLLMIQKAIMIAGSLGIVIGIGLTIVFRYFLKTDLYGTEELLLIFAFWLYFMGGSYASYEKSHITADLLSTMISNRKVKLGISLFTSAATMLICLIFTYWGFDFLQWGIEKGAKTTALGIPMFVAQSSVTFGFLLMSLYSIVHFIRNVLELMECFSQTDDPCEKSA